MASRSWLTTLLYGVRQILDDGDTLPERNTLNFIGLTITDDPVLKRTNVEATSSALLAGATSNATPNKLVLRNAAGAANFADTCNFVTVAASVAITSVDITASASCSADTIDATTSVTSPLFESASAGVWRTADQTANSTNSGAAIFKTGDVAGTTSSSGALALLTGSATLGSGGMTIRTGDADGAGNVGELLIAGGDHGGAGAGGSVYIKPGAGATVGNIALLGNNADADFADGERCIWMNEAVTVPTVAPVSGGILYIDSGDGSFHFLDRNGLDTPLTRTSDHVLVSAAATVTVSAANRVIVATHAAPTIDLHAGTVGDEHTVKYQGAGTATITPFGGETLFDSASVATFSLSTGESVTIVFDGTYWSIV